MTPQPPQLFSSILVFTHCPEQSLEVPAQPHVALLHTWPCGHLVSQPPQ
jgi:hypothetical protein